ncbi:MAG: hypothetical protein QF921_08450, partial [Pseudomonadales bacterium]|nr:hypothetical protein [Pseudomonadales bacterium]
MPYQNVPGQYWFVSGFVPLTSAGGIGNVDEGATIQTGTYGDSYAEADHKAFFWSGGASALTLFWRLRIDEVVNNQVRLMWNKGAGSGTDAGDFTLYLQDTTSSGAMPDKVRLGMTDGGSGWIFGEYNIPGGSIPAAGDTFTFCMTLGTGSSLPSLTSWNARIWIDEQELTPLYGAETSLGDWPTPQGWALMFGEPYGYNDGLTGVCYECGIWEGFALSPGAVKSMARGVSPRAYESLGLTAYSNFSGESDTDLFVPDKQNPAHKWFYHTVATYTGGATYNQGLFPQDEIILLPQGASYAVPITAQSLSASHVSQTQVFAAPPTSTYTTTASHVSQTQVHTAAVTAGAAAIQTGHVSQTAVHTAEVTSSYTLAASHVAQTTVYGATHYLAALQTISGGLVAQTAIHGAGLRIVALAPSRPDVRKPSAADHPEEPFHGGTHVIGLHLSHTAEHQLSQRPRVDLIESKFARLIETKGARLAWDRALICPCARVNEQTKQPDPNCPRCNSTGFFYFGPKNYVIPEAAGELDDVQKAVLAKNGGVVIRGVMASATRERDAHAGRAWDQIGNWVRGDMRVTVRPENKIGYYDRLVNLDSEVIYTEIVTMPTLASTSTDRPTIKLRYPAISVTTVQDTSGIYEVDGAFDLYKGDLRWHRAVAPAAETRLAVHYTCHPAWLIMEHPHTIRETTRLRKTKNPKTPFGDPQPLPIQAVVRLEFL